MGQKRLNSDKYAAARTRDDSVASFEHHLQQKYGAKIDEPVPEKLVELLLRLEHLKTKDLV